MLTYCWLIEILETNFSQFSLETQKAFEIVCKMSFILFRLHRVNWFYLFRCFTNDFFARNSNSMETSPCCNSVLGHQIETNFCTCHDNTTVVPCTCTKVYSDHCIRIEVRVKRNFHRIWIVMEKTLVKQGPVWHWLPFHGASLRRMTSPVKLTHWLLGARSQFTQYNFQITFMEWYIELFP